MKKMQKGLRTGTALSALVLATAGAFAGMPAYAQDTAASGAQQEEPAAQDIIVTGSRIARPNLEGATPVTVVTAEQLQQTARISIGDVINDLPQVRSTYSQQNSSRFLGTGGLNLVDLYGLGTQRTLVLVNGRRHVGADILNNAVSPDLNTFPTDLIEDVQILTGGSSAVYGSDAIAGVVNFKLKQDFEGLQMRGQGSITDKQDAGSYSASLLAGKNFAGGRGNIAVDLEYAHQNDLFASDRSYYARNDTLLTVDNDPAGLPNGSDGVPDNVFFRDVRSAGIYSGGLVSFSPSTTLGTAPCGRDNQTSAAFPNGRPFTCNYIFASNGDLIQQTGSRVGVQNATTASTSASGVTGVAPGGAFIGGNGNTRREDKLVQLLPRLDRYAINVIGHFDVSSAFTPFVEAKYVRTESFSAGGSGPAFFTGSTIDALYERPRLDNPYLSSQARTTITNALIASGVPAANIGNGTRFIMRKNLTDLGMRSEAARRETFRIVGGVRGDLGSNFRYEVAGNYGQFTEHTKVLGNVNTQRLALALDSARNGSGQIVCASQIDPNRAEDFVGNDAILQKDIAACKPLNPFGVGNISQDAKNYVLQNTVSRGKITQLDFTGFVSGDTGTFFNLPGGPVGVAVGGEYRRETAFFKADPLVEAGYTFYNALAEFNPPSFEVKEAFGELNLPLLKDIFLVKEFSAHAAARVSDYKGGAGTVWAYNFDGTYSPVKGIMFRAAYSRSVRAPNLTELYAAPGQNFAPGFSDPCSQANLANGTQYRPANCAAAVGTGFNYNYAQSLETSASGNPNLQAEKSDSYTYGVVIQPPMIPGLSLTVDYYNIAVNNVITSPSPQQVANACYDSPTTNNQFCSIFKRDDAAGSVTGTPFRILEGSLLERPLNYAQLKVRGINAEVSYLYKFSPENSLGGRFVYTHQLTNEAFLDPTQPGFADNYRGEVGDPRDAFNVNIDGKFGKFFFGYQMRYLSKMAATSIEALESFQGRPATNLDFADINWYRAVTYHDLRIGVSIRPKQQFFLGIDNLTDERPPLGSTGIGGGSGIYDNIGRRMYAGFNVKF
ncbi:TonB-dependent receptor [uncultured Sphingomonas sp.]|uniref:TonB-dependent receptor domain-containing protein n=1 Tax=uncultured Sphingomonas sp. TaxID=158754 RepID=UPI0025FC18B6|nr:TonB-dependent receptor [uncultured Sphingomonas sp.]